MKEVYVKSWQEAMEQNEIENWRESRGIFRSCKSDMDNYETGISTAQNPKEMRIVLDSLSIKYGYERIQLIMARTIQSRIGDGRFDRQIRAWAESVDLVGRENLIPASEVHSAMLNYALRELFDMEIVKQMIQNGNEDITRNYKEDIEDNTRKNAEDNIENNIEGNTEEDTEEEEDKER